LPTLWVTFLPKISKSIHVHQRYSKPKVGRFFETRCSIICRISPASGDLSYRPPTGALSLDPNRGLPSPDFLTNPLPKSLIRPCTVYPIVRENGANTLVLMRDVPRKLSQRVWGSQTRKHLRWTVNRQAVISMYRDHKKTEVS